MLGLLTAMAGGVFSAGFGIAISHFSRTGLDMFRYLFWNAFFTAIICFAVFCKWNAVAAGEVMRFPAMLWWITGGGICSISGSFCVQRAMKKGHNNIIWAIQQSAMILPFFSGVLFFSQRCSIFQLTGVMLMICGIAYPVWRSMRGRAGSNDLLLWLSFALGAFCLTGSAQAMQNVPSYWLDWQDTANLRPALAYSGGALGSFCFSLFSKRQLLPLSGRLLLATGTVALWNVVTVTLMFKALDICSRSGLGSIGYPVIVGSSIISFSLYSCLVLKEKNTRHHWLGLGGILAGIVIIAL